MSKIAPKDPMANDFEHQKKKLVDGLESIKKHYTAFKKDGDKDSARNMANALFDCGHTAFNIWAIIANYKPGGKDG